MCSGLSRLHYRKEAEPGGQFCLERLGLFRCGFYSAKDGGRSLYYNTVFLVLHDYIILYILSCIVLLYANQAITNHFAVFHNRVWMTNRSYISQIFHAQSMSISAQDWCRWRLPPPSVLFLFALHLEACPSILTAATILILFFIFKVICVCYHTIWYPLTPSTWNF